MARRGDRGRPGRPPAPQLGRLRGGRTGLLCGSGPSSSRWPSPIPRPGWRPSSSDCTAALVVVVRQPDRGDGAQGRSFAPVPVASDRASCAQGGGAVGLPPSPPPTGWPTPSTPRAPPARPRACSSATPPSPAAVAATVGCPRPRRRPPARCACPRSTSTGRSARCSPPSSAGGAVVIRPREALLFPRTFFNAVANEAITYTGFSPSYLRLLAVQPPDGQAGRHHPRRGGPGRRGQLGRRRPGAVGRRAPGRASSTATAPPRRPSPSPTSSSPPRMLPTGRCPSGRPTRASTFHLVDEAGRLVDGAGRVGELYIGGAQLMDRLLGRARADRRGPAHRRGRGPDRVPHRRPRLPDARAVTTSTSTGPTGSSSGWGCASRWSSWARRMRGLDRRVRRGLRGLRRRRPAGHRRLRGGRAARFRRSTSAGPPANGCPSRCCPTGSSWSTAFPSPRRPSSTNAGCWPRPD